MSGRITQSMTTRTLLSDLQSVSDKLSRTQARISSGKVLTAPSDDPYAATRAVQLRSDLSANQQYQRNVAEAQAWQNVTDTALTQVGDFALRAKELTIQGATGSMSDQGRQAIAAEMEQLIGSIKSEANAQYAGRYVFSGAATTTAPYSQTNDSYTGDANGLVREIGQGVSVTVNVVGDSIIGHADGTGRTGMIGTLRQIVDDLKSNNLSALQGADLTALDTAHDALTNARAVVGALSNRLETAGSRLSQLEESSTKLLSDTEDADMAKTLVDYSTQQAVYQAALKAGAQLIQPSLIDFLR